MREREGENERNERRRERESKEVREKECDTQMMCHLDINKISCTPTNIPFLFYNQ